MHADILSRRSLQSLSALIALMAVACAQGQVSTSRAPNDRQGLINEEFLPGETVAARVDAASQMCAAESTQTCLIMIPPTAPSGTGWAVTANNVTIRDLRNRNGFGYPDGELAGMRASVHYVYHAGVNETFETQCVFCGRNVLVVDAVADKGQTTNGSNASLQAIVGSVHRLEGSSRQIWGGNFVANYRNLAEKATGLEVDTSNEGKVDDVGLASAGVRIINNGMHAGIGLQIDSVIGDKQGILPEIRGYMVGIDDEDYHIFGIKLNSRDDAHIADLYIVPSSDSAQRISIIGRNTADNATRWVIYGNGAASFQKVSSALSVVGGISNNTGLQHMRGEVGCSTRAAVGATCTSPQIRLPFAFADLQYTLTCTLESAEGTPTVVSVTKQTSSFEVEIAALTNIAATARYNCAAIHD